jgi:RNA polymerase sigma-70 factor (ECF subfamily)
MNDSNSSVPSGHGSSSSRKTSTSLLGRARTGDPASWERLVTLYAPMAYQWCRRRGLHEPDAADIVQDVFQAVAAHLDQFDDRRHSSFRAWLRTITENKIRDHFRRKNAADDAVGGTEAQRRLTQVPAPSLTESSVADEAWDDGFLHRAVELVRAEFEEKTWQAFWRTAIDGRSPADVGAELAMSSGAVRVAKFRVLKRLHDVIGDLPQGV